MLGEKVIELLLKKVVPPLHRVDKLKKDILLREGGAIDRHNGSGERLSLLEKDVASQLKWAVDWP
ncbi:hypothetical protein IMZ48_29560 [Candidatus Bathyarchaeota archaeon]|nr:hypothetical protein [Candidatus Bathyarchaeota archaeon]